MATEPRVGPFVVVVAVAGGALGLLLIGFGAGQSAARACSAAAASHGACAPGALAGVKPYVTAGLIGLLLGALIAIAVVIAWRDARRTLALLRGTEAVWPGATATPGRRTTRPGGTLAGH